MTGTWTVRATAVQVFRYELIGRVLMVTLEVGAT